MIDFVYKNDKEIRKIQKWYNDNISRTEFWLNIDELISEVNVSQIEPLVTVKTAEEGCTCQNCGNKYKVDFIIPDDLWIKISPQKSEAGMLCGICTVKAIEEFGEFDAYKMIKAGQVEPEVKVNFAEIEKELNDYAEETNGRIMDNADACDHLQSKLNYINDNFYLIRK